MGKFARIAAAIAVVMAAGCVRSTGIITAGPNTYALTIRVSPIAGGAMTAEPQALQQASAFCRAQGREMLLTSGRTVDERQAAAPPEYDVTFRCLLPSDPEFQR